MLEESIKAIENAENATLIWLAMLLAMSIVLYFLRLGSQALAGFFGSDKAQNSSIAKLSAAVVETNKELLQTNRELSDGNKKTVERMERFTMEVTAALATLNREVLGVRSTASEHYELGKIIHDNTEGTNKLITDNSTAILTKLDTLIAALDTQHKHSRNKDAETTRALQQIHQIQWWLQVRLQTEFPQLALPAPQKGVVA